jgi:uncharacterized membrane protein YqhA
MQNALREISPEGAPAGTTRRWAERTTRGMLRAENFWENNIIFGARWLLTPAYLVLVVTIFIISYKSIEEHGS